VKDGIIEYGRLHHHTEATYRSHGIFNTVVNESVVYSFPGFAESPPLDPNRVRRGPCVAFVEIAKNASPDCLGGVLKRLHVPGVRSGKHFDMAGHVGLMPVCPSPSPKVLQTRSKSPSLTSTVSDSLVAAFARLYLRQSSPGREGLLTEPL
jgi:hypothetical protein